MGTLRIQVRVPKFIKTWSDSKGYTVSDVVRLGLSFNPDPNQILRLSFIKPNYRTTISLSQDVYSKLEDLKETTGLSRDRLVSAVALYATMRLDESELVLERIWKSLMSYGSVWMKVYDDVERLKTREDEILSKCNGNGIEIDELVSKISNDYEVPPTAVELFLLDAARRGKIMIMNGVVKSLRVV